MNPNYVTGFSDGEACFFVAFQKSSECITGWQVRAGFSMALHHRDKALLEQIKSYFGVAPEARSADGGCYAGDIFKHSKNAYQYRVTSTKDLINVIIPHFLKYPLITEKRADFELFKQVVYLIDQKKHLTPEGVLQILNIKATMNRGLSDTLKAAFPKINPVTRPVVEFKGISDPY